MKRGSNRVSNSTATKFVGRPKGEKEGDGEDVDERLLGERKKQMPSPKEVGLLGFVMEKEKVVENEDVVFVCLSKRETGFL